MLVVSLTRDDASGTRIEETERVWTSRRLYPPCDLGGSQTCFRQYRSPFGGLNRLRGEATIGSTDGEILDHSQINTTRSGVRLRRSRSFRVTFYQPIS
jgi:hypothetical protein